MDSGVYNDLYRQVSAARALENERAALPATGLLSAYAGLAKPRSIWPHFITAAAAMFLAAGSMPPISTLLLTLLGGGCIAAAANALNCVLDGDIDALMARTRGRPLPSGLVKRSQALVFAVIMALVGTSILGVLVNRAAALLAVTALVYYVLVYTLWLRRRTYWGAVFGSAIGAIPPLIGWVVVANRIDLTPVLLSAIVILWTVPHFWALGLVRRDDYAKAGLRVIPEKGVGALIGACSSLLVAASLLLAPGAHLGAIYVVAACALGVGLLYLSVRLKLEEPARAGQHLYRYSIVYIAVLFAAMIIDRIAKGA